MSPAPLVRTFKNPVVSGSETTDVNNVYRYVLTRRWWDTPGLGDDVDAAREDHPVVWVMLNPSTATAYKDDQTMRKVIGFSRRWGYDSIVVLNLFAYRSTYPKDLELKTDDPVGADNDLHIKEYLGKGLYFVLAWGSCDFARERAEQVKRMLKYERVYCIGMNKDGSPKHPSRVGYEVKLTPFPV